MHVSLRSSRPARAVLLGVLALVTLLAVPRTAEAHVHLRSSSPAAGATLDRAPGEIRLIFSERPTLALTKVELVGPSGAAVPLEAPVALEDGTLGVRAAVAGALAPGRYTVTWRTAAADGHPARGTFGFTVSASPVGTASAPVAAADSVRAPAPPASVAPKAAATPAGAPTLDVESPLYVIIRWVLFAATLGAAGACAFVLLIAARVAFLIPERGPLLGQARVGARRVAIGSALILLLALLARFIAQRAVLGVPSGALLAHTLWGWGWVLGVLGAGVALGAFMVAGAGKRAWRAAALGIAAVALSFSLTGHAVAAESFTVVVVLADAIHVLAAGGWLGTLLLVAGVGIHAALRAPAGERGRVAADLVNAFSPFALACATVIALTGIIAAWTHLSGLRSLWESGYGQVLLIKLGVLAVLAALGAYNWRVQRPRLAGDASALGLRRTASAELVVGALVLAVTAVLVAMPTPDARTPAPVAQRSATP